MKKVVIVFFLLFSIMDIYAQTDSLTVIIYDRWIAKVIDTSLSQNEPAVLVEEPFGETATVHTDSSSLIIYAPVSRKFIKSDFKIDMGREIIHHARYFNFELKKFWDEVNVPAKSVILVEGNFQPLRWNLFEVSKTILGYSCKMAIGVDEKNDSTIVWYTNDLNLKTGKLLFVNAPGTILSAYSQHRDKLFRYEVKEIFEYEAKLFFPENHRILGARKYKNYKIRNLENDNEVPDDAEYKKIPLPIK